MPLHDLLTETWGIPICCNRWTAIIASKPDKYGQKFWLAVDKDSMYIINGFPYVGKDELQSKNDRLSDSVVMKLMGLYLTKEVTTDSYFTSI